MWIYGGLQNQGEISDFLKHSHTLNKWKKITANGKTPGKRMASRICYGNVQGSAKIFLFGGSCNKEHLNDLWEFDILSNTWTEIHYSESQFIPYIPGPRRSHVFEYLDGVLYVIGGKIGKVYTRGVYSFRVHESKYKNYHYDQDLSSDFNNFFRKQKLFDHTITLKNNEKIGTHLQLITQSLFSPFIINNNKTKIIELISNFYESIGTGEHYSSLLDLYNDEKSTNLKINLKDNNSISFHKIVLAARSEYFNEKSITNNSDFEEIDDPFDLSYEAWQILKSYLYLGSIHEFTKKHIKLEFKQKIDKMKLYSTDLKKFLLITENFN
ncbi:leucine-zipper-like transcriptional regulator [Anaeramoeba flamelloides]|uniref:Leucine-zipper-like transcriptional regulator n=1 Tax=Anaeramoeba flamelloides TaxID=1746091 RepID=A0AAV7Z7X0_9EUKA|nr:leucine-zipper-like transcriptional regulator [Anaeramoeba flamelloides]